MKLSLPITPRYLLPVMAAVLLLDIVIAAGVAISLYRMADRVKTIDTEGHSCLTYSPSLLGATYVVIRCSPKTPE